MYGDVLCVILIAGFERDRRQESAERERRLQETLVEV